LLAPDHPKADGAWAEFTGTPEVYVVVAARAIQPADIRLTRVLDGSRYSIDLGAWLEFPGSIDHSIKEALGIAQR